MPKTQSIYLVPDELRGDLTAEEFRHLKRRVVAANKAMGYWYQQIGRDYTSMTAGHVSVKVPGTNTFIVKGRPPDRDLMSEVTLQTLVQIDISTKEKVAGEMEVATPGEIELHTCVYEARPDVISVCHGHSNYAILCGLLGLNPKIFGSEDFGVYDRPHTITSPETGIPMAKALGQHSIVMLKGHGAVAVSALSTAGKLSREGPEDCIMRLIKFEELCQITWQVFTAVGKDYEKYAFSDEIIQEARRLAITSSTRDRFPTPGKDMTKDQCYYNAAMARTFREAIEG
ncbi:MAG: class II aldolase/adducin family protein [Dehalococcoidales bacterium]|nr:class II aldolase/adducin family protein [Dehalococcoidales bacterium]